MATDKDRNQDSQSGNQGGGNQGGSQSGGQGQNQSGGSQSSGSGEFQDNRMNPNHKDYDPDWQPGPVGAVEDEENDGRLKENREAGRTKGTTPHSAQAPSVDRDTSGSINADEQQSGSGQSGQGGSSSGGQGGGNR
jgi:hypothetical protein